MTRITDRTRMVLCMMMFAIFALNPIGMFTRKDGYSASLELSGSEAKSGRTLLNLEDDGK